VREWACLCIDGALINSECAVLNERDRICKEVVVTSFKILSLHLSTSTGGSHGKTVRIIRATNDINFINFAVNVTNLY
jgi:hypothetical protein